MKSTFESTIADQSLCIANPPFEAVFSANNVSCI